MVESRTSGLWKGLILVALMALGLFLLADRLSNDDKVNKDKAVAKEINRDNTRHLQEAGETRRLNIYQAGVLKPYEEPVVPNTVHYVWLGQKAFKFHHLVSIASAKRILKPDKILFHTNVDIMVDSDNMDFREGVESGRLWKQAREIPGFTPVRFQPTEQINNITLDPKTQHFHSRIQILKRYGGIYLDDDVIVINSFSPLMIYEFVIGRENSGLNTGIMLSKGNVSFLAHLLNEFRMYGTDSFSPEGSFYGIAALYPETVHVEPKKFRRLDALQSDNHEDNIFFGRIDHYQNYALKLYYDLYFLEETEMKVKYINTTFGELARLAYYGTPSIRRDWPPNIIRNLLVPNIIHYVWFGRHDFHFHHFLSIKSALHIQKAEKIMFHTDATPTGVWWEKAKKIAGSKLNVTRLEQPTEVFGRALPKVHYRSDVARLQVLLQYGGIFIEEDTLIVRSLDAIRHFPFTMGLDVYGLNNGVMLAEKGAEFLRYYYDSYHFFNDAEDHFNSAMEPYRIGNDHPDSLNIEEIRLTRPDWTDWFDMGRLWRENGKRDWSHMLCVQLKWINHDKTYQPEDILQMDTTFGEIARFVYFGSKDTIKESINIDEFHKGFERDDGHEHILRSKDKNVKNSPLKEMEERKMNTTYAK
ncbi:uncharacterized protein [Ptychodera flava]|uniref:uncharacterized protein isoform X1 n=1 Tax=Ptychodera flava TaxID=63121 RepID=UPI00396A4C08